MFACLLAGLMFVSPVAMGQAARSDMELLAASVQPEERAHHHHRVEMMETRSGSWFARFNPVSLSFTGLMFVYQRYISPQTPSRCLYETSCSQFSKNLVLEYGLLRGVVFTADRLTRCNRVSALDVHPLSIGGQSGKVQETTDIYRLKK